MTLATAPDPPDRARIPVHIAVIMDGNRRWARAQGKPPIYGHRQGAEAVRRTVEGCARLGVRYLTLYAFSSENWRRPAHEVGELMALLRYYLQREVATLHENDIRVRVIGERVGLDPDIVALIEHAEQETRHNRRLDLVVALNYGGRQELVRAARLIAERVAAGLLDPGAIDERLIRSCLYTHDIPDPDLLIRTSGEQRVSNFLLWQLAYTEFVFLDVPWPEFDVSHLLGAIAEYARRERRYGASAG